MTTTSRPLLVIVESPYAAPKGLPAVETAAIVMRNETYARRALADCFRRDEIPFASHLLFPQPGVLRDADPKERARGIQAGFKIAARFDSCRVYEDYGRSDGMQLGVENAKKLGQPIEYRKIGTNEAAADWNDEAVLQRCWQVVDRLYRTLRAEFHPIVAPAHHVLQVSSLVTAVAQLSGLLEGFRDGLARSDMSAALSKFDEAKAYMRESARLGIELAGIELVSTAIDEKAN